MKRKIVKSKYRYYSFNIYLWTSDWTTWKHEGSVSSYYSIVDLD